MKILKFGLPNCKPCVELSKQMQNLDLTKFEIQEINLKHNVDLLVKYGVKSVPTLIVLDKNGGEIKRLRNFEQLENYVNPKVYTSTFGEKSEKQEPNTIQKFINKWFK